MSKQTVVRYSATDRLLHWVVAVTFLLLTLTGLGLFEKSLAGIFVIFGGGENAILIHKVAGIVFFFAAVTFTLSHLKDTSSFDADDKAWLSCMGGYLKKGGKAPPAGKYNAGQKIFGLCALGSTLVFGATALVMWSPASMPQALAQAAFLLHSLAFVLMAVFFVIHVYLGTVGNPGTLQAMTEGEVSVAWARKHSPKWLAQIQKKAPQPGKADVA